jgi:hypothetical protein
LFHDNELAWSATFADSRVSLVFSFGDGYRVEGLWDPGSNSARGHIIGALSEAHAARRGPALVQGTWKSRRRNLPTSIRLWSAASTDSMR